MVLNFKKIIFALSLVVLLAFTFTGCSDEDPAQPQDSNLPTFSNIWPASVDSYMEYELYNQIYSLQENLFANPDDIPEIPSMENLYTQLQTDNWGEPTSIARSIYNMEFTEDLSDVEGTTILSLNRSSEHLEGRAYPPSQLSIGQHWTHSEDQVSFTSDGLISWLHLDGDLTPGHNFTSEILGTVETHLNSRIWQSRSYTNMDIDYPNCIECFFVLDMGVQTIRDENGTIEGYYHPYSFGVVIYAPEVGPVFCQEKIMRYVGVWENRKATLQAFGNDGSK